MGHEKLCEFRDKVGLLICDLQHGLNFEGAFLGLLQTEISRGESRQEFGGAFLRRDFFGGLNGLLKFAGAEIELGDGEIGPGILGRNFCGGLIGSEREVGLSLSEVSVAEGDVRIEERRPESDRFLQRLFGVREIALPEQNGSEEVVGLGRARVRLQVGHQPVYGFGESFLLNEAINEAQLRTLSDGRIGREE